MARGLKTLVKLVTQVPYVSEREWEGCVYFLRHKVHCGASTQSQCFVLFQKFRLPIPFSRNFSTQNSFPIPNP